LRRESANVIKQSRKLRNLNIEDSLQRDNSKKRKL